MTDFTTNELIKEGRKLATKFPPEEGVCPDCGNDRFSAIYNPSDQPGIPSVTTYECLGCGSTWEEA